VVLGHYGYESIWLHDNSLEGEAFSEVFGQVQGFEGSPSEVALGMATSLSSWWQGQALVPRIAVLTLGDLLAEREELAAALRASPGDAYRQEARALGTRLGQVLDGLDTTPWIVVAGLHGQDLGESQPSRRMPLSPFFHDILLERTVHVPLWAFGPGEGGSDAIVEIRQILPTLLGLSGAELPAGAAGSLLDPLSGPVTPQAYAEFGDMLALWRGDHVFTLRSMAHNSTSLNPDLTQALREAEPTSAVFALHRIAEDPLQERNLSQSHQAQAQAMREALTEVRTTDGALPRKQLPPAQLQILRQPGAGYW
jgi:arylsulfatase A-like enzyme